jgi:hypothetical protein
VLIIPPIIAFPHYLFQSRCFPTRIKEHTQNFPNFSLKLPSSPKVPLNLLLYYLTIGKV